MAATDGTGRYAKSVLQCPPLKKRFVAYLQIEAQLSACCHSIKFSIYKYSCFSRTFKVNSMHIQRNRDLELFAKGYDVQEWITVNKVQCDQV